MAELQAPAFVPEAYERHLVPLIFEPYARDLATRVGSLKEMQLLELACGTGVLTRHLARAADRTTEITATDVNPGMLAFARGLVPEASSNLMFQVADGNELPFEDASFDVVVCQFGVMFFPDKPKAMTEAKRVLKPGGRLIFNVWGTMEDNPVFHSVELALQELLPDEPVPIIPTPCSMADRELLKALLVDAGFEDVQVIDVTLPVKAHPASSVASGFTLGTPVGSLLTEKGVDKTYAHQRLEATARKHMGDPLDSTMLAIICEAKTLVKS